ncbi:MAG: carboxyl-terminal processing protease [Polaribacter sp.]|jgi:carboxyl-terminal processing protease
MKFFKTPTLVLATSIICCSFVYNVHAFNAEETSTSIDKVTDKTIVKGAIDLAPEAKHRRASRYIAYFMKNRHYKKQTLDNEQSGLVLDNYIKYLDGNKAYFLAADIKDFERYRYKLDDAIWSGLVQPAFHIYDVFQSRWEERNTFATKFLETEINFSTDDNYFYDRDDSAWAKNEDELNAYWTSRIKNDALNLVLADKSVEKVKELLGKRYAAAMRRSAQVNSEDVFSYFMNAYANTVDPHTSYFSPRTAENFDIDMKLSLEGIGAVLQTDEVYTKINMIVTGGPADKSKQLAVDDRIISVGQDNDPLVDVVGWRLDDVVDLIRGSAGTQVRLEIESENASVQGKTKTVSIIREKVKLEEQAAKSEVIEVPSSFFDKEKVVDLVVDGKQLEDKKLLNVGVIDLPKFYIDFQAKSAGEKNYRSTTRDIKKLIETMQRENDIQALIIDLRSNGGGSLGEAISLTGLFIDEGPVVQEKELQGKVQVLPDIDPGVAWSGPLAVLVNGSSASASEIFAGAIQDYDRGLIIGEQTFGKGTVQNVIDLNYFLRTEDNRAGALKLTIDKFYRITGESTQLKGVMPDIKFPDPIARDRFGESSYVSALQWDVIDAVSFDNVKRVSQYVPLLTKMHQERVLKNQEYQYIVSDIQELNKKREESKISLSIEKRKQERLDDKTKRLTRENIRREITGKKSIKEIDEDTELVEIDDVKLYETAKILSDLISIKLREKTKSDLAQVNKNKNNS